MRDALSILDRLMAGGAATIAAGDMEALLGLPSQTAVTTICDNILDAQVSNALDASASLLASGVSMDRALEELATCFRHTLIALVCGTDSALLELSDTAKQDAATRASGTDENILTHMIALCDAASRQVRQGGSGRALFDATIARLCLSKEMGQAGATLKDATTATSRSIKKKSSPLKAKPALTPSAAKPPAVVVPPKVDWDVIRLALARTPGLKRIASYLICKSITDNTLELEISEEGADSSTYIHGRRAEIERVCLELSGRKFTVEIAVVPQVLAPKPSDASINPEIAASEIVKTASDLFDGTLLHIREIEHISKSHKENN